MTIDKPTDYLELLKRYIQHVSDCEGTTFLSDRYRDFFTPDDFEILHNLGQPSYDEGESK